MPAPSIIGESRGRFKFKSKLAAGRDGVKTRVNTSQDNVKIVKSLEPICTAVRTDPTRKHVWELKYEMWKKIQGLCLLSLSLSLSLSPPSWNAVSLCPVNTVDSAFILSSFLLDNYLKSVVANKLSCSWIKTEFCVFVNFSHCEVTIESGDNMVNIF